MASVSAEVGIEAELLDDEGELGAAIVVLTLPDGAGFKFVARGRFAEDAVRQCFLVGGCERDGAHILDGWGRKLRAEAREKETVPSFAGAVAPRGFETPLPLLFAADKRGQLSFF